MIPVIMTADNNYIIQMAVAIYSLGKNTTTNEKIEITVLCATDFKDENKKWLINKLESLDNVDIHFFVVDSVRFENVEGIGHVSLCSYYRLLIPEIVKDDRCLFLDADLIIQSDIRELFEIELGDNYLAAAVDVGFVVDPDWSVYHVKRDGFDNLQNYFNAGVLLMNIKKMREDQIAVSFFEEMNRHNYLYMDQDVLNRVCKGKVKLISAKFNCFHRFSQERCYRFGNDDKPVIIHYAGPYKPWDNKRVRHAKLWWDYAKAILNPNEYLRLEDECMAKMEKYDWNYILQSCKDEKVITIVGYSLIGVRLHDCLKMAGIGADISFCDSSPKKHGLIDENIYYFNNIPNEKKKGLWLISSQNYHEDIYKELVGIGIPENRIIKYYDKKQGYYEHIDDAYLRLELEEKFRMMTGKNI